MHTATAITVTDRAGTHTAVYVPPPSRQPRPVAKTSRYDRSAIMTRAWADYRAAVRKGWTDKGFDKARWSYCLAWAWMLAKGAAQKAADLDAMAERIASYARTAPAPTLYSDPVRAAAIKGELQAIEMSDATSVYVADRELALNAELSRLRL